MQALLQDTKGGKENQQNTYQEAIFLNKTDAFPCESWTKTMMIREAFRESQ